MRHVATKQERAALGMLVSSPLERSHVGKARRPSSGAGMLRVGVVGAEVKPGRLRLEAEHCTCRSLRVAPASHLPLQASPWKPSQLPPGRFVKIQRRAETMANDHLRRRCRHFFRESRVSQE